jgi:hypothetical protein
MAGVLVNNGEDRMLGLLVNKSGYSLATLQLRLFKSNTTPAETDTAGTYTEADFTGYASVQMASADWTLTPGAPSQAVGAQKSFTSSADQSAQTIYGYYLTENGSNALVAAERFAASASVANNGDIVKVTPTLTQA